MTWTWTHPEPDTDYGRAAIGKRHYAAHGGGRGRLDYWTLHLHVIETTVVPLTGTIGRPHQPGGGTAKLEITNPKGTQ